MNKLRSLLLLTISINSISFAQIQKAKFEITGKLYGFPDSTIIYLFQDVHRQKELMDSALIINSKFHSAGFLMDPAIHVALGIKGYDDYKYFWLGNSIIRFTAEKGKFTEASIMGSKTEEEQEQFNIAVGGDMQKTISFVRNHPNSIIGAFALSVMASQWGKHTSPYLAIIFLKK